jgi:hypothetical protein
MLAALIKRYWQVCIFKETPANTPYSFLLLCFLTVIFYLLMVLQWVIVDISDAIAFESLFLAGVALIASYSLYTYALLLIYKLSSRMVQTLTCLIATHTIVHLLAFPLLLMAPLPDASHINPLLGLIISIMYLIFTLILTVWQFMVTVHIYKNALGIENIPAILASFGLLSCNILIISLLR